MYDRGLMTITPEYRVRISPKLKSKSTNNALNLFLLNYDGKKISLPDRFIPASDFLKYHNENIFIS